LSKVREVTSKAELEELVSKHNKVIVDFAAPSWCVPCRRLAPHYEAASERVDDALFVHIDVDEVDPTWVQEAGVQGVPTVHAYVGGEFVGPIKSRTAIPLVQEVQSL
jgi:thioredoxin 2